MFAMVVFQESTPLLEFAVAKDGLTVRADIVPILGMSTILASIFKAGCGINCFLCHSAIG